MAAHRYWRLKVLQAENPADTGMELSVFELFDDSGVNAAITGNGTASASYGTTPAAAFDGNTNTFWSCANPTFPQWLAWDFGPANSRQIIGFRVYSWVGGNHPGRSTVEFSDDGIAWYPLFFMPPLSNNSQNTALDFKSYVKLDFNGDAPLFLAVDVFQSSASFAAERIVYQSGSLVPVFASVPQYGALFGPYKINSTVMADLNGDGTGDVFLSRRVWLFDEVSMTFVRSVWSAAVTGAYSFDYIPNGRYTVLAYDYARNYRAVVADNLTPVLMP